MPIVVRVVSRGDKGCYFRWKDSAGRRREEVVKDGDGNIVTKSKIACEFIPAQREKLQRLTAADGSILWGEWREQVSTDYCSGKNRATKRSIESVLNRIESTLGGPPKTLAALNAPNLSRHARKCRELGRSENTIASHFRTLHGVLAWAVEQGHIASIPSLPRVPRATGTRSRGRPLTDQEFAKVRASIKGCVEPGTEQSWDHFLEGLWLSGLRLSESLRLAWEPSASGFWLDWSDPKMPKLAIQAKHEKGKKHRLLPLTPDFADWLNDKKNCGDRKGLVFRPLVRHGRQTASRDQCSHVISAIGAASGVETEPGRHPTAHDLRRSFGLRWAMMIKQPVILQQLMRHTSIQTTLEYYARADADRWGKEIYAAWENRNNRVNQEVNDRRKTPKKTLEK